MSAAIDITAAQEAASASVKRSGTSFAAGMAILPRPRRAAMHAIYAFCREVDDIADDECLSAAEKHARLDEWRREIDRLFAGKPSMPVGVALLEPVRAYDLPKNEFLMMIEGMEMDTDGPIVAPSMEKLFAYTRRVAGAVGLLSMPVFGAPKGATSDRFALALGDALQLTNILRDVVEDAAIGRLYLPTELLTKHSAPKTAETVGRVLTRHLSAPDESAGGSRPALQGVAEELAEVARAKFTEAREALTSLDWRSVRPALLMMGVYEAYLRKMTARGWARVGEPVSLSKAEKLFIAARYGFAPPLKSVRA